jgi:hypothetical protein
MSNRQNHEVWHCDTFSSDHLWSIAEHAENQIREWTRRRDIAIGHLATRGEVLQEYPTYGEEV